MISRQQLLTAAEKAHSEKKITRLELVGLRFASLNPNKLEEIQRVVEEQAVSDKAISSEDRANGINWDKLIPFIQELLPLILKLLNLS